MMQSKFNIDTIDERKEKLYIKDIKRIKGLKELVKYMLQGAPATYHDVQCTNLHCYEHRRRSISDTFFVCKAYYPEVTFREVLSIIHTIPCGGARCTQVRKYVFNAGWNMSRVVRNEGITEFYSAKSGNKRSIPYNKLVQEHA